MQYEGGDGVDLEKYRRLDMAGNDSEWPADLCENHSFGFNWFVYSCSFISMFYLFLCGGRLIDVESVLHGGSL